MVDSDILEQIEKVIDWVILEKPNGKLPFCLNPRPLNNAIKREHPHLPTAEEFFHNCPVLTFSQN